MAKEKMKYQHHAKPYVSNQQIIHKCLLTYQEISSNMPFNWYVERVEGSINRKGVIIERNEIINTVYYFLKFDYDLCPHCKGTGKGENK